MKTRQHLVPKSYLRAFAENDQIRGALREPRDPEKGVVTMNIASAAAERHFYRIHLADGTPSDDIEDALAEFDSIIPDIVARATSSGDITPATIADLKYLYANLAARGQMSRDLLVTDVAATWERVQSEFEKEFPGESSTPHADLFASVIRGVYEHPERLAADPDTVSTFAILPRSLELFEDMPRFACVFESDEFEIVTSDAPFCIFDPDNPPDEGPYGADYRLPRVELTLPLSRRHVVMFANLPIPSRASVNAKTAMILNARTVHFAKRQLLMHPSDMAEAAGLFMIENYRQVLNLPLLPALEAALT